MPTISTPKVQQEETEINPTRITDETTGEVVPRCSGRVVRQPVGFMFWESLQI
jgi:hypothetical protein